MALRPHTARRDRPFSLEDFVSFCRTIAARDDRPLERVPLSSLALQGHFGGWFAFLVRIGVLVDDPVSAGRDRGAPHLDAPDRARRRDMVLAVRMSDGPLRREEFFRFFRQRSSDGEPESGSPDYSLSKYFGTFRGLLLCAGLGERHHDPAAPIEPPDWERGNERADTHYTDEQLLAFVDAAARVNGGDVTAPQLKAFAAARRRAAQQAGTRLNCPSVPTIVRRFGAIAFALAHLGYISDADVHAFAVQSVCGARPRGRPAASGRPLPDRQRARRRRLRRGQAPGDAPPPRDRVARPTRPGTAKPLTDELTRMDSDGPATAASVAAATEPSEVAAVLADVADALPEHAARTLLRLLQNDLAERSTPLVRLEGLGLLAQMVDATGEVPTGEEYEALRARRAEVGEQWPDRTTLARTSGGWIRAVRAAMRLWLEGGARGYPPAANRRQATVRWSSTR